MAQPLNSVQCPHCGEQLPVAAYGSGAFISCLRCACQEQVEVFPALTRPPASGQTGENLLVEGESSCFYHSEKKAAIACEGCGRFLCSLCDVEFLGRHLCPVCIQAGKNKKKIRNLETQRVLYDDIALTLAIVPLIIFFATVITAPITLFICIRYWNAPTSILPRSKWRFVVAALVASLQICGWAILFLFHMAEVGKIHGAPPKRVSPVVGGWRLRRSPGRSLLHLDGRGSPAQGQQHRIHRGLQAFLL